VLCDDRRITIRGQGDDLVTDVILRGLWQLTWIEIKIILHEPLGTFGTIGFPVLFFPASRESTTEEIRSRTKQYL
jgi:hypothetical protein